MRIQAFALLLLLASTATPAANPSKTFTFRLTGEPETLDWNRAHTPIENYILMNIMEGLVAFDTRMQVVPALAKSWKISKDGRTYTFRLRDDVKWTDGQPLKAADFVFSWKRLLLPSTGSAYAYFLYDIEGAEAFSRGTNKDFSLVGVKALDDHTLQVKLAHPVAYWLSIPTFWVTFPLRADVVEKYGTGWATPGRMATLGPYSLVSHDIDQKIVLRANPTYYGKRGNVEEVVARVVKDDSTALTLYESGKLDFLTDISTLDLSRLKSSSDRKEFAYLKTGYLGLVSTKFPTSNVSVRRAIAMAIDKSKLGAVLHGGQKPATSFVPPPMMAYSKKVGLPFSPERARAELRSSGLDLTHPVQADLVLPNLEKPEILAQFIQGQLKKNLGMEVTLQPYDNKTFRAQTDLKANPLFILSWGADYPDPDNFLSVFLSTAGNNRTGMKNLAYDEKVLKGRSARNKKDREKTYLEAQKILLEEEAAIIPLYYEPNLALVKPRVKGLVLSPLNYLYLKGITLGP